MLLFLFNSYSQKSKAKIACIAFYNIENLFDTIDDENVRDTEFTPQGSKEWTKDKYEKKQENMATVISQIGSEYFKGGPFVLGVSEIENRGVLEDLVNHPKLKKSNYKIVHYDSPDRRGVDVALLYRADYFKLISSRAVEFTIPEEMNPYDSKFQSRDQLVVSGIIDKDTIHVIVNHWPSRRGGEKKSRPLRNKAADLSRSISDSILQINPNAKIFVMGDFNDNPTNESIKKHLKAKGNIKKLQEDDFFNPFYKRYKKGIGTTAYRDVWSLFDQIIISQGLINCPENSFRYFKSKIFREKFLLEKEGKYQGYPKRTFSFDKFQNGYSDHLPVYMFLVKNIEKKIK